MNRGDEMSEMTVLLRRSIWGDITSDEARVRVHDYWESGYFIHQVPPVCIPPFKVVGPPVDRYGLKTPLLNFFIYGERGQPGCLLVKAPHDVAFDKDFTDLNMFLHIHNSDHIAVVVEGHGIFFVQRNLPEGMVIIQAQVSTGSIMFYPKDTPHTFAGGSSGITVASMQCEFEPPDSPKFASLADESVNSLPRIDYSDYLRGLSNTGQAIINHSGD